MAFAPAFVQGDDSGNRGCNSNDDIARGVELDRVFEVEDSPSVQLESTDSSQLQAQSQTQTLQKPLTDPDLSGVAKMPRLRVAYQGLPGAYSESAAAKAYTNCELVPCAQFETTFDAVEQCLVDHAVLPIENSLGGSIHRNYDLLLRYKLHIVGEVRFAVHHCLLVNHGVEKEDLKRVLSHPQALAQCEQSLVSLGVVRESVNDTAGAAQFVAVHKLRDTGAVASSLAAKIYGLKILASDIQDNSDNVTRFLMLARDPVIPQVDRPFKTSIVFTMEEGPGALFKALAVFASRDINLSKIESRPLNKCLRACNGSRGSQKYFRYCYYVDFEASMACPNAQNALRHLQEVATYFKVFGSYPIDVAEP